MNMRDVFIRQITEAWGNKELTDVEYKLLLTEERVDGETGDDFDMRMFKKLEGLHADKLFERVLKGAEYIDSIGKDHPNYKKAMERYDRLSERMNVYREQKDPDIGIITRWDIYTKLRDVYLQSGRRMDEEELSNVFPLVDAQTIQNGIQEFDWALLEAMRSSQTFEEETQ